MGIELLAEDGHFRKWLLEQHPNETWLPELLNTLVCTPSSGALSEEECGMIETMLHNPKMACTSLNISRIKSDDTFRITMMRARADYWLKGYGETFLAAAEDLQAQIDSD